MDRSSDAEYMLSLSRKTTRLMTSRTHIPRCTRYGKHTEEMGVGSSVWATISEMQETVSETVGSSQIKSQTEVMLEELEKVNTPQAVPATEEDTVMVEIKGTSRMDRVEELIKEMRDNMEELRDNIVDVKIELERRPTINKANCMMPAILVPMPEKSSGAKQTTTKTEEITTNRKEHLVTSIPEMKPGYQDGMKAKLTWSQVAEETNGTKELSIVRWRKRLERKKRVDVINGPSIK